MRWATALLTDSGVDAPRLDAEILMSHALGKSRAHVYAWPRQGLSVRERAAYQDYVVRRADREPIAYITGHREFYGLDFHVDPRVLIPRPETELLVEQALRHIDICGRQGKKPEIADVGTGSGVVAITLALHRPAITPYALDCERGAIAVARQNAVRHGVAHRIRFILGDLLKPVPHSLDLILANLPYVGREEWEELQPEIALHEPRVALDGGEGGLEVVQRLLEQSAPMLRPGGVLILEIGAEQGEPATRLARGYFERATIMISEDYAGRDRVLRIETG